MIVSGFEKIISDFHNYFQILLHVLIDYSNICTDDEYDSDNGKETNNEFSPQIETETTTARPKHASTEMPNLEHQVNKLASESRNVFSSYENVYEGVPLDPKINRLSLDASELDVGDRFDTKQMDLHLRTNNRTSSYEQVYAKDLTDQSAHSDLGEK